MILNNKRIKLFKNLEDINTAKDNNVSLED